MYTQQHHTHASQTTTTALANPDTDSLSQFDVVGGGGGAADPVYSSLLLGTAAGGRSSSSSSRPLSNFIN